MRIGLLTGGGDCPGLNAVIRAVVKALVLGHGAEVVGFEDGFEGLIEDRARPLALRDVGGLVDEGGTILGTSNTANPFNYGPAGGADVSDRVLATAARHGLDALVVVGGDGTMTGAGGLIERGMRVIGVPKTIDNDLVGTDRTFGFDTAVAIASEAMDRLHTTAQSHHRVIVVETMGRYTGWIALHAGLASGADVILIPERPYGIDEVARVCRLRETVGRDGRGGPRFTIVAIAEGARQIGGALTVREVIAGSPDPLRLGGAGAVLADALGRLVESEVRTVVLGHVQRGGSPTPFDRILATRFGVHAAHLVASGASGCMVALVGDRVTDVDLERIAGLTRTVPDDDPVAYAAEAVGVSFGVPAMRPLAPV